MALRLYTELIASHDNTREAGCSRAQIQNIVHSVVPDVKSCVGCGNATRARSSRSGQLIGRRADSRRANGAGAGRMTPQTSTSTCCHRPRAGAPARAPSRESVRVFVSFDPEHDEHLYGLLLEDSRRGGLRVRDSWAKLHFARQRLGLLGGRHCAIRFAIVDQVVVICGEHTGDCLRVVAGRRASGHPARNANGPTSCSGVAARSCAPSPSAPNPARACTAGRREVLQERIAYLRRTDRTAGTPA